MMVVALHKFRHEDRLFVPGETLTIDDPMDSRQLPTIVAAGMARRMTDGELYAVWDARNKTGSVPPVGKDRGNGIRRKSR